MTYEEDIGEYSKRVRKQISYRSDLLDSVKGLVNDERLGQYGEGNFRKTAAFWTIYLGVEVKPYQVPEMLQLMKTSRNCHQRDKENYTDGIGYLSLAASEAMSAGEISDE